MKIPGVKYLLALALLLPCGMQVHAQEKYSLGLGFGRQRVGMPFQDLLGLPPHPSFFLQVSRKYGDPKPKAWYQTAGVLTFNNNAAGNGYLLFSHTGKNVMLTEQIALSPELGISMIHRFHPRQTFSVTPEGITEISPPGSIRPGLDFRISISYRTKNFSLAASYQINAELFYNETFPLIPVNYIYLGMMVHLKPIQP